MVYLYNGDFVVIGRNKLLIYVVIDMVLENILSRRSKLKDYIWFYLYIVFRVRKFLEIKNIIDYLVLVRFLIEVRY